MVQKQGWFVKFTGWGFRFFLTAVFAVVMLCQGLEYIYKTNLPWSNALCALIGLAGAGVFFLLAKVLSGHVKKKSLRYLWMGLLSLLVGCLVFYASGHYGLTPLWDIGELCANAQIMTDSYDGTLNDFYFSTYPNNFLLSWLLAMSFRFAAWIGIPKSQEYFVGLAVQSLGFGLASFLAYICADKLVGKRHPEIPLWIWFMMLIMVCMSPWVVAMYSDSASLIIVMIEVWLYLQAREKGKFMPLWAGLLAFMAIIAWHIKPQGVVIFIAIVLVTLFSEIRRFFVRENLKKTGILLAAMITGAGLAEGGFRLALKSTGIQIDPEISFGPAHYFMMGLNEENSGVYLEEDFAFSATKNTRSERTKADLERAFGRIREMGFGRLMTQLAKKTMIAFGDGTFTWEKEIPFYAYEVYYFKLGCDWGFSHIPNFYISEEYEDMVDWSCSDVFQLIEQCAWMAVLFLGLFAFSKRTGAGGAALLLALVGMVLFQVLFECRGRYEFCYAPVHILAAGMGIANIKDFILKATKKQPDAIAE